MAANNCTVELVHGGTVHVAHSPKEVEELMRQGSRPITLTRIQNDMLHRARGFPEFHVNPDHIVGIFPLSSGSTKMGQYGEAIAVEVKK